MGVLQTCHTALLANNKPKRFWSKTPWAGVSFEGASTYSHVEVNKTFSGLWKNRSSVPHCSSPSFLLGDRAAPPWVTLPFQLHQGNVIPGIVYPSKDVVVQTKKKLGWTERKIKGQNLTPQHCSSAPWLSKLFGASHGLQKVWRHRLPLPLPPRFLSTHSKQLYRENSGISVSLMSS